MFLLHNHATLWSNLQDCKISSRAEIPKLDRVWHYKYFQDPTKNNVLQVIIEDESNKEAFVFNNLEKTIWLVTGKGADFYWYPVSVGTQGEEMKLHSKNLFTWIPHITKDVHFLICQEDGSTSGRWRGPSYTVEGLGNDFQLLLEKGEENDINVFISASISKEKIELKPQPCKEYFLAHMNARNQLKEDVKTAVMLPLKVAGLAVACASAV